MSKLAELLKGGAKLVSNVGEDYVVKLPQHLGGKEVNIPKHMLGLGNVEVKAAEASKDLGKVLTPDMDKQVKGGFGEVLNPRGRGDLTQILNKGEEVADDPITARLKAMAKGSAAGFAGGKSMDMMGGTMDALKNLGNKYEEDVRNPIKEGMANLLGAKDASAGAIGKRMLSPFDISKDKSGFPEIEETVGDYATDPMSLTDLIPGKAQAGAAIKGGREILPKLVKLLKR